MDTLSRLQNWYVAQCDGDWEHQYGVKIGTLDNPGWSLTVSLEKTAHVERPMETFELHRSEDDWLVCGRAGTKFEAFGGPKNLGEMLERFFRYVDA